MLQNIDNNQVSYAWLRISQFIRMNKHSICSISSSHCWCVGWNGYSWEMGLKSLPCHRPWGLFIPGTSFPTHTSFQVVLLLCQYDLLFVLFHAFKAQTLRPDWFHSEISVVKLKGRRLPSTSTKVPNLSLRTMQIFRVIRVPNRWIECWSLTSLFEAIRLWYIQEGRENLHILRIAQTRLFRMQMPYENGHNPFCTGKAAKLDWQSSDTVTYKRG